MRRQPNSSRSIRWGMTPGGCFLVGLGVLAFVGIIATIAGVAFYRNFGPHLFLVRDEIVPVGEQFVAHINQESYQPAYALLTPSCREEWPPEKFAAWVKEIHEELGEFREFRVLAQPTVDRITQTPLDELSEVPIYLPCVYDKGVCSFEFRMKRTDDGWRIDELKKEIELDKAHQHAKEEKKKESASE